MDRFVTVHRQKDLCTVTASQSRHIVRLREELLTGVPICLFGPPGVGKTFVAHKALEGLSFISLENTRIDFLESPAHLLLDDITYDGAPPRSLGSTLVISTERIPEGFQVYHEMEPLPDTELLEIAEKYFEGDIRVHSKNIRTFLTDLEFSDARDLFPTSKDFVASLLSRETSTWDFMGHAICEHGFCCGLVHENYIDTPGALKLSDWFSLADIHDDYSKNLSLFSFLGILAPITKMGVPLDKSTIRPGSSWTKYNNHKMRAKKFSAMSHRFPVDIDSLTVLNQYCLQGHPDAIAKLKSYGFQSSDLDVMNHLMLSRKMKPRALLALKKKLKSS